MKWKYDDNYNGKGGIGMKIGATRKELYGIVTAACALWWWLCGRI